MGRVAQVIKKREDGEWYRPDIGDNRSDPEPFRVRLLPMSATDFKKYQESSGNFTGGKVNFNRRAWEMSDRIISERVLEVENYAVRDPDTEVVVSPKNGRQLVEALAKADPVERESVTDDIVEALKDSSKLRDGLVGNSNSRPDSP